MIGHMKQDFTTFNHLSANPTKLFGCARPFCEVIKWIDYVGFPPIFTLTLPPPPPLYPNDTLNHLNNLKHWKFVVFSQDLVRKLFLQSRKCSIYIKDIIKYELMNLVWTWLEDHVQDFAFSL